MAVSALQGIIAKEQVISSMKIIAGLSHSVNQTKDIFSYSSPFSFFDSISAYAFTAFNLFTVPCATAMNAMFQKLKEGRLFLLGIAYQFFIGWGVSAFLFSFLHFFQNKVGGIE